MELTIDLNTLLTLGLKQETATTLINNITNTLKACHNNAQAWQLLSRHVLSSAQPFAIHRYLFSLLFPAWPDQLEVGVAWMPEAEQCAKTNMAKLMAEIQVDNVPALHRFSVEQFELFWEKMLAKLRISFQNPPTKICDLTLGVENPIWLPGAKMNIAESCLLAPATAIALTYYDADKKITHMTYGELNQLSNQIANSLIARGFKAGDAIGIAMTMNAQAIAIYLGIIKMGGIVVSIADSFSSEEMAVRLRLANAKAVFTQDEILWGGKVLALYEKVKMTNVDKIIVLTRYENTSASVRPTDYIWQDFLLNKTEFTAITCDPMQACNILFSSGTTGEPKAIVWNHTTPIKAASDAYLHHDIQSHDKLAWPTNLGWMMGPWLIFAALINQASIALYPDAPKNREFGEFISKTQVTMLGVVPTLVATWRETQCMQGIDWSHIKAFSSTGECSNPEDMLYLMSLAGYKPVIEYCGGTEIGGAYLSSTLLQNNYPSVFTTPTMGLDITILDEEGHTAKTGELAIIPPSIGLSTVLLNADHYRVYFENMPKSANGKILRRHGDQIMRLPHGGFCILGRADDTMNLGGIKTSAAEIERVLINASGILEVAAIAIPPKNNGPNMLVIYAATTKPLEKKLVLAEMQKLINQHLNPLFRIYDVVLTNELPKTASNKIMRRTLRKMFLTEVT